MITLWKCAIRNSELCSTKSAGGTASSTPVMPPTVKVSMKATAHIIGSSKRILTRYMVNSQLNSLAPEGIEMIIVVMMQKLLTLWHEPMVKKRGIDTRKKRKMVVTISMTTEVGREKCEVEEERVR